MNRIAYYDANYRYQLAEDYTCRVSVFPEDDIIQDFYVLTKTGVLLAKKGYAWDGPSGPALDTKDGMRGSLVHDILYQAIGEKRLDPKWRKQADRELYRICREDGMNGIRASYWYLAVRLGGSGIAETGDEILYAP